MNPGTRDRLLSYQEATEAETASGSGEYAPTWATTATAWAAVSELSAREVFRAGQVDAETPAVVVCDYKASEDFAPSGRFLEGSTVYRIQGVREVGRNGVRKHAREFRCVIDYDGGA